MKAEKFFLDALNQIPSDIERKVEMSMSISDRIASILAERGMTQKEFAKGMGKTEAEVSRWLGGLHNFTISTLSRISDYLGEDIITIPKK